MSFIVYESEFREAALMLKPYGATTICLWNILMTKVDSITGEISVSTFELAELLKTHRPNISKSLKLLKDIGLIAESRKQGRSTVYRINPSIIWKRIGTERDVLLKSQHDSKMLFYSNFKKSSTKSEQP